MNLNVSDSASTSSSSLLNSSLPSGQSVEHGTRLRVGPTLFLESGYYRDSLNRRVVTTSADIDQRKF